MDPYIYAIIIYCTNNINTILKYLEALLLILMNFTPIKFFKVKSYEKIKYLQNTHRKCFSTSRDENNKPYGLILNRKFIAYIYEDLSPELILITSENIKNNILNKSTINICLSDNNTSENIEIDNLVKKSHINPVLTLSHNENIVNDYSLIIPKDDDDDCDDSDDCDDVDPIKDNCYRIIFKSGGFDFPDYDMRDINFSYYKPRKNQSKIINDIKLNYNQSNRLTVFLSGTYGSGKTMLTRLLSKNLKACLMDKFNPSKPNTYLHSLYNIVNPSKKKPLVLVIDEVDILLNTIVKGIPEHKRYDRLVDSKTSWNSFLDDIDIGIYKNLILILCSNKSKEEIDKLDPSFLRKGRVHMYVNMNDIDYIDKNL